MQYHRDLEKKTQAVTGLAFNAFLTTYKATQVEPVSSFFADVTHVPRCEAKTRPVINKLSKLSLYHHETIASSITPFFSLEANQVEALMPFSVIIS
jgi:hypothetical protein